MAWEGVQKHRERSSFGFLTLLRQVMCALALSFVALRAGQHAVATDGQGTGMQGADARLDGEPSSFESRELIVLSADGYLYAVDIDGDFKWSFKVNPDGLTSHSSCPAIENRPIDARLFVDYTGGLWFQDGSSAQVQLPVHIKDVVAKSPFVTPLFKDTYFVGTRTTEVISLDNSTGEKTLVNACLAAEPVPILLSQGEQTGDDAAETPVRRYVRMGKTIWTVAAMSQSRHSEIWRIAWVEISSIERLSGRHYANPPRSSNVRVDGRSLFLSTESAQRPRDATADPLQKETRFKFPSTIVTAFSPVMEPGPTSEIYTLRIVAKPERALATTEGEVAKSSVGPGDQDGGTAWTLLSTKAPGTIGPLGAGSASDNEQCVLHHHHHHHHHHYTDEDRHPGLHVRGQLPWHEMEQAAAAAVWAQPTGARFPFRQRPDLALVTPQRKQLSSVKEVGQNIQQIPMPQSNPPYHVNADANPTVTNLNQSSFSQRLRGMSTADLLFQLAYLALPVLVFIIVAKWLIRRPDSAVGDHFHCQQQTSEPEQRFLRPSPGTVPSEALRRSSSTPFLLSENRRVSSEVISHRLSAPTPIATTHTPQLSRTVRMRNGPPPEFALPPPMHFTGEATTELPSFGGSSPVEFHCRVSLPDSASPTAAHIIASSDSVIGGRKETAFFPDEVGQYQNISHSAASPIGGAGSEDPSGMLQSPECSPMLTRSNALQPAKNPNWEYIALMTKQPTTLSVHSENEQSPASPSPRERSGSNPPKPPPIAEKPSVLPSGPVSAIASDCELKKVLENGRLTRQFDELRLIGKGGFGAVCRARHKLEPASVYAIKFVPLELYADENISTRRYLVEVSANRDLFSRYVVRYFTWWVEEPQFLPLATLGDDTRKKPPKSTTSANDSSGFPRTGKSNKKRKKTLFLKRRNEYLEATRRTTGSGTGDGRPRRPQRRKSWIGRRFGRSRQRQSRGADERSQQATEENEDSALSSLEHAGSLSSSSSCSRSGHAWLNWTESEFGSANTPDGLSAAGHPSGDETSGLNRRLIRRHSGEGDHSSFIFGEETQNAASPQSEGLQNSTPVSGDEESGSVLFKHTAQSSSPDHEHSSIECPSGTQQDGLLDTRAPGRVPQRQGRSPRRIAAGTNGCGEPPTSSKVLKNPGVDSVDSAPPKHSTRATSECYAAPAATDDNVVNAASPGGSNHRGTKHSVVMLIQMELCSGITLRRWLDKRPKSRIPTDQGDEFELFRQLIKGMRDIHNKGIVHRDLKPENIFIDEKDMRLKICDFGLARFIEAKNADSSLNSNSCIQSALPRNDSFVSVRGQIIGTPGYTAPEGGAKCTGKADVYSAALILLELLCPPFGTMMERTDTIDRFRTTHEVPKHIQKMPRVYKLLLQMSKHHPDDRPSADEVYLIAKSMSFGGPIDEESTST